jgi:hypothetical protein
MYIPVFTFYIGFNTRDIYLPHVSQKSLLDPIPGPAWYPSTLADKQKFQNSNFPIVIAIKRHVFTKSKNPELLGQTVQML